MAKFTDSSSYPISERSVTTKLGELVLTKNKVSKRAIGIHMSRFSDLDHKSRALRSALDASRYLRSKRIDYTASMYRRRYGDLTPSEELYFAQFLVHAAFAVKDHAIWHLDGLAIARYISGVRDLENHLEQFIDWVHTDPNRVNSSSCRLCLSGELPGQVGMLGDVPYTKDGSSDQRLCLWFSRGYGHDAYSVHVGRDLVKAFQQLRAIDGWGEDLVLGMHIGGLSNDGHCHVFAWRKHDPHVFRGDYIRLLHTLGLCDASGESLVSATASHAIEAMLCGFRSFIGTGFRVGREIDALFVFGSTDEPNFYTRLGQWNGKFSKSQFSFSLGGDGSEVECRKLAALYVRLFALMKCRESVRFVARQHDALMSLYSHATTLLGDAAAVKRAVDLTYREFLRGVLSYPGRREWVDFLSSRMEEGLLEEVEIVHE
jgi:hypothetical protein